ncbi:hypothetical protein POPTR_015G030750v4 [Populus trichocarpa]|uniref:Uncharacterized protein n=1 Tax=Populus trichocarpa TaxID=3694 RepID=A0ACC0RUP1_POPTR|nr:hypothetical protein POPTR_015G030750v4 [Populus trichocarpa]
MLISAYLSSGHIKESVLTSNSCHGWGCKQCQNWTASMADLSLTKEASKL